MRICSIGAKTRQQVEHESNATTHAPMPSPYTLDSVICTSFPKNFLKTPDMIFFPYERTDYLLRSLDTDCHMTDCPPTGGEGCESVPDRMMSLFICISLV